MATSLWAMTACWTVLRRARLALLCDPTLTVRWVPGFDGVPVEVFDFAAAEEVGCDAAAPPDEAEVDGCGAVPALPDAALLALEVWTAVCALLIADWYRPTPCELELLLELPLSANVQSAKNATVPTRRAMSERDAGIASLLIGS